MQQRLSIEHHQIKGVTTHSFPDSGVQNILQMANFEVGWLKQISEEFVMGRPHVKLKVPLIRISQSSLVQ